MAKKGEWEANDRMKILSSVDLSIPLLGALSSLVALLVGLRSLAEGCLAGSVVVSLDWLLLRLIFGKLAKKGAPSPAAVALAAACMAIKFLLLVGFIYLIINTLHLNGYGVAVGIGSLPLGIIVGSLTASWGKSRQM